MCHKRITIAAAVLSFLLSSASATAQDTVQDSIRTQVTTTQAEDSARVAAFALAPVNDMIALGIGGAELQKINYDHLGDALGILPGVFVRDLGAAGQALHVNAAGLPPVFTSLSFDGLDLRDPVSGIYDANLVPVASVEQLTLLPSPRVSAAPHSFVPSSLVVRGISHDAVEPRSRVVYRKGDYGYSDLDINFGMKINEFMDFQGGGLVKEYDGSGVNEKYEAQKIRGKLNAAVTNIWRLQYVFLLNKADTEIRLSEYTKSSSPESRPYTVQKRFDHGVSVDGALFKNRSGLLSIAVQHTDLRRKIRDNPLAIGYNEDARVLKTAVKLTVPLSVVSLFSGAGLYYMDLESGLVGGKNEYETDVYAGSFFTVRGLFVETWLGVRGHRFFDNRATPNLRVQKKFSRRWKLSADYQTSVRFPSIEERFMSYDAWLGSESVLEEVVRGTTLSLEFAPGKARFFCSGYWRELTGGIVPEWSTTESQWILNNGELQRYLGVSGALVFPLFSRAAFGGNFYWQKSETEHECDGHHAPDAYGSIRFDWSREFFAGDLDLTVRLYCTALGKRYGVERTAGAPGYAQRELEFIAVPGAQIYGRIMRNAMVFVAFDNLLDLEYEWVPGYPMPGRYFRWGITWDFVD